MEFRIQLRKELYDLLKEYCEWAGHNLNDFVEYSIFDTIKSELDYIRASPIPKGNELWEKIKELEEVLN